MIDGMSKGDFYILCPDNAVTREMDEKRIRWAADDLIKNRPALSRWHPDYKDAFDRFMKNSSRALARPSMVGRGRTRLLNGRRRRPHTMPNTKAPKQASPPPTMMARIS